ncbi:MAG: 50S ribosomal protein L11 methyltransferase [Candidatus Auribacterota bacterium]|jgi:ribosomal protein L11 methyltransferase|nr:50S ribosomal protein L11 methyltransferase [Candidatus Auribacterota bacterium]
MPDENQVVEQKEYYVIEIVTSLECEDPLGAFIETNIEGLSGWVFDQKADENITTCNIYFDLQPDIDSLKDMFKVFFAGLRDLGIETYPAQVELKTYAQADWTEVWKTKFRSFVVGKRLVIKPSWEEWLVKDDEVVIECDPGLAFGTGQHPTTRFCLEVLERYADKYESVLDIGCGSGILCIAAAKLGAKDVYGFDIDQMAIDHAQKMVKKNMVESSVTINQFDLKDLDPSRKYDIVLANLYAELLVEHGHIISQMVKAGGLLALTGILYTKSDMVRSTYERLGMKIISSFSENEWFCFLAAPQ